MCSLAARGLWIELMCAMTQGDRFGYLEFGGRPATLGQIKQMVGGGNEIIDLVKELEQNNVFSRDAKGTIYSRRMVADYNKAQACSMAGKKGGNAALLIPSYPMPEEGWSFQEVLDVAQEPVVGLSAQSASLCYDNYAAASWMDKNGNPVARNLNSLRSLLRRWKNNQASFGRSGDPNGQETIKQKEERLLRTL